MIRLSRLDRKNPSCKDGPFLSQGKIVDYFEATVAWPWRAAARTNFASEKIVHERQAARAMMTFCFINAASRYHDSPVKQRAVHKDSKGGIAHHGRFPPLPMKKPRNTYVSEAKYYKRKLGGVCDGTGFRIFSCLFASARKTSSISSVISACFE